MLQNCKNMVKCHLYLIIFLGNTEITGVLGLDPIVKAHFR